MNKLLLSFLFVCLLETTSYKKFNSIRMAWTFGGEMGTMRDFGAVGSEGEYYFHQQKHPKLRGPEGIVGKQRIIAIFPYNSVMVPGSLEKLNIFEMKYRQLLADVGEASFGLSYYSQPMQKLALVGTLGKVKNQKLFDDGRINALVETRERYFIEEVISERPYIKARVRTFKDFTESPSLLDNLERSLFSDIQANFRYLNMLYPDQNYNLSTEISKNQPLPRIATGTRSVKLFDESVDLARSSKFSFAVVDVLKAEPAVKLMLLQVIRESICLPASSSLIFQEHITEKRLARLKTICDGAAKYLVSELKKQGVYSTADIERVREELSAQEGLLPRPRERESVLQ